MKIGVLKSRTQVILSFIIFMTMISPMVNIIGKDIGSEPIESVSGFMMKYRIEIYMLCLFVFMWSVIRNFKFIAILIGLIYIGVKIYTWFK